MRAINFDKNVRHSTKILSSCDLTHIRAYIL
jgi:hypothetical protein